MTANRNVMFIVIDQLRADTLFGALSSHVDLPNLRALALESVTFQQHYSVANPCGPSRASLLTGQYAMNHRSVRNRAPLRHDIPNLATEVRKAGYLPMLFGYTDTSQDPRVHHPNDPAVASYEEHLCGFEQMLEMRKCYSYPWRASLIARGYDVPDYSDFYVPVASPGKPRRVDDPAFYSADDSDTTFLTDSCLGALAAREGERWFTHLTYIRPHPPLVAPHPYNRMYDPASLPLPQRHASEKEEHAVHPSFLAAAGGHSAASQVDGFPDLDETDENIQKLRAIYLGLASEVDHHIGRVVSLLKESGQFDETLLIVTADHGEMLGDHHSWGKAHVYDAAYHIPLIIRDPLNSGTHGKAVTKPTETVDTMPTILEWMGLPVPASVNGHSLMRFLRDGDCSEWRDTSYSELTFGNPLRATAVQEKLGLHHRDANLAILRSEAYSLVHFGGGLPPLLFDRAGEGEMRNVAEDPDHAKALLTMTRRLLDRRMAYLDTTISNLEITDDGPRTSDN
ncbi:MAG: sulfatase-like hydrolase/transferase [Hyphomicrobiales bacterium]|nr:sulfatase-like hydrolase/transferase [Hyphomicrobiales bacterium]